MNANVKNKYRLRKQLQEWLYDLVEKYCPEYEITVTINDKEKESFVLTVEMGFSDNIPPITCSERFPVAAGSLRKSLDEFGKKLGAYAKEYEKTFRFAIESDRERSKLLDIFNAPGGI